MRNSDHTVFELIAEHGLYDKIWQFPVVLVPVGGKVGEEGIVLRPVDSTEAMTASAYRLPMSFLDQAAERFVILFEFFKNYFEFIIIIIIIFFFFFSLSLSLD